MAKIKLVEKKVSEGKSGAVEINSGFSAYYEKTADGILLEVTLIDKNGNAQDTGTALDVAPFMSQRLSDILRYAAEKAIHAYVNGNLQSPNKDGGKSTAAIADQLLESSRMLSYERHFNSAAVNILLALGED